MKITNVLYINLTKREDRKIHVEHQLSLIGLSGERFPAIELKNGLIGCGMSHLKCMEMAKERDWDHVFICEDDITFTNPKLFLKQLHKFFKSNLEWDVILAGGNNIPPYEKFGDFCIKVSHCQTTTGYIVRKPYYDTLINNLRNGLNLLIKSPKQHVLYGLDKFWISLQKKDKWFLIIPPTVIQNPGYSDIEKRETNYTWHLTDIDKKRFMKQRKTLLM